MGGGTTLIGSMPHTGIGLCRGAGLLVYCGLFQGGWFGGEWGGAVLLAYESLIGAGFFGSIPQSGVT